MKQLALLGMMISLTCCSTTNTSFTPVCAPVVEYGAAKETQAGNELKNCPCPEVKEMMKDSAVLRQANRECER